MHRRTLFGLAGAAVAGLAAGCATQQPGTTSSSPAASPATIGLTYIPNVQFAPFYLAETAGLFSKLGSPITLRHHGAQEGLFTAIAAGQEQFVIAGGDELMQARGQGIDLVAIAAYYHAYPVAVLVRESSPITTLAGLRGKRIGVPGRYGETWFGALLALRTAGLAETDVTIVEIGYTQQAALAGNKVDAVIGFVNNDQVQFTLAGLKTRAIPLTQTTPPLVGICLATTGSFLREQPELCTKVADAMLAGVSKAVSDPAVAVSTSAGYIPSLDERAARATLDATAKLWTTSSGTVSGKLDPTQWATMSTFLADTGITGAPVDPASAFTNAHVSS